MHGGDPEFVVTMTDCGVVCPNGLNVIGGLIDMFKRQPRKCSHVGFRFTE